MKKINMMLREYQSLVVSVTIVIAALVVSLFGIYPIGKQAFTYFTDAQIGELEGRLYQQKLNILESFNEETLKRDLLVATSAIPLDKSAPSLIETVEAVASKHGVAVSNISLSSIGSLSTSSAEAQSADEKKLGSYLVSAQVSTSGTFSQMRDFFYEIINVRRLLRVLSFDMSIKDEQSVHAQITVDGFYAPIRKSTNTSAEIVALTAEEENTLAVVQAFPLASASWRTASGEVLYENKTNPFSP